MRKYFRSTAEYFADYFWTGEGIRSLLEIFPILGVMNSKDQLIGLLEYALRDAYRRSLKALDLGKELGSGELVLQGQEQIERHLMIVFSDTVRSQEEAHFYVSKSFLEDYMMKPLYPTVQKYDAKPIFIHIMLNAKDTENTLTLKNLNRMVAKFQQMQSMFKISLWIADIRSANPFFYHEEHFVLSIHQFSPQFSYGVIITDKTSLLRFNYFNSQYFKQRLDLEYTACDSENKTIVDTVITELAGCQAIFSFANIGFLVTQEDLDKMKGSETTKALVVHMMEQLMHRRIPMVVSLQAMDQFAQQRHVVVPLLGRLNFDGEEIVRYLAQFQGVDTEESTTVHLVDYEAPMYAVLILENYLLLYLAPSDEQPEMLILLPKKVCPHLLLDLDLLLQNESVVLHSALWQDYLKALPSIKEN